MPCRAPQPHEKHMKSTLGCRRLRQVTNYGHMFAREDAHAGITYGRSKDIPGHNMEMHVKAQGCHNSRPSSQCFAVSVNIPAIVLIALLCLLCRSHRMMPVSLQRA